MADEETVSQETQTPQRPEYIPEKFWDTNKGEPNVEAMASSYNSLERKFGQRTEDLSKSIREDMEKERITNAPEKYEVNLPSDIPEDVEVNIDQDQPLLQWWQGFAKDKGLNQGEFNKGIDAFIKSELSSMPDHIEEMRKLGDNSKERVEAADIWAKKYLTTGAYDQLKGIVQTSEGIKAVEEIMSLNKSAPIPKDSAIDHEPDEMDLRSMMKDPRYWDPNEKDDSYIRKVTDLYAKKYKDK